MLGLPVADAFLVKCSDVVLLALIYCRNARGYILGPNQSLACCPLSTAECSIIQIWIGVRSKRRIGVGSINAG